MALEKCADKPTAKCANCLNFANCVNIFHIQAQTYLILTLIIIFENSMKPK